MMKRRLASPSLTALPVIGASGASDIAGPATVQVAGGTATVDASITEFDTLKQASVAHLKASEADLSSATARLRKSTAKALV